MRSDEPCSFPAFEGGSILIVTVWVLFLLGILAAAVGVQAARRLEASERLRGRVQAYAAARAGVATAVAVLALDTNGWDALSERWADSPADFCAISCGNGRFSVVRAGDGGADGTATNYGASDESARIDLNQAGVDVIRGLLIVAGGLTPQAADELSKAIDASRKTSGRDGSKTPILTPFFCVQDLLAVPGVDDTQFRRLEPYLTVHSGTKQININTAENERILAAVNSTAKTYTFGVFNTLLGLPGVVNALKTARDPSAPDVNQSVGGAIGPETDIGWPVATGVPMTGGGDVQREHWLAPLQLTGGLAMPPAGARTIASNDTATEANLLGTKNTGTDWNAASDGVAALRLSSMIMANRTEHPDGRYYENPAALVKGAGKDGTLKRVQFPYPLSNESVPEWRFDEIDRRFGRMANLITTRSDVFEILVTVQAGTGTDANGDNRIDYRDPAEFTVTAESQGRVIYERRARTDRSDEAASAR